MKIRKSTWKDKDIKEVSGHVLDITCCFDKCFPFYKSLVVLFSPTPAVTA
jgi:hypothetical protein